MARLLGVSLSGDYQWRQRQPSQRSQQKQALQQAIARVYARFDGSAGSPLITAELREQAEFAQLSRTRVAREMQTLGLRCRLRMAKKILEPPRVTQLTGSLATNWIAAFERRLQTRFGSVT